MQFFNTGLALVKKIWMGAQGVTSCVQTQCTKHTKLGGIPPRKILQLITSSLDIIAIHLMQF